MDEGSTERVRPKHSVSRDRIEILLNKVRYIDFYEAMSLDNYRLTGLTAEEYGEVMVAFKERMDIKQGSLEKQISEIDVSVTLLTSCLIYVPLLGLHEDDIEILDKQGVAVADNIEDTINNIQEKVNSLTKKRKLLSGELPKLQQVIKTTGEDMIAELSLNTEMRLPMNLSLLEYISYYRAVKKKNEQAKRAMAQSKSKKR